MAQNQGGCLLDVICFGRKFNILLSLAVLLHLSSREIAQRSKPTNNRLTTQRCPATFDLDCNISARLAVRGGGRGGDTDRDGDRDSPPTTPR